VEEASERENNATQALRDGESDTQDDLRKLRSRVDELTSEQSNWQGKQREYEEKIQKNTKEFLDLQSAYGDLENKRKSADGSRTEIESLKAKLSANEKVIQEKNKSVDKQAQLLRDEIKHQIEELKKENEKKH